MVAAIAQILKTQIGTLPWIQRYGGLVTAAEKPKFVTDQASGDQKASGTQIYPVACDVNAAECWENGKYKYFVPDSSVASLGFFMDNGGSAIKAIGGPGMGLVTFTFDIRFVCWLNIQKMGVTGCNFSSKAVPYVIGKITGQQPSDVFGGGIEEQIYQNVTVNSIQQMLKTPAIFAPFFFAQEGAKRGLFLYPFDYFGLNIRGTFDIAKDCLPTNLFPPDFEFIDETCKPE